MLSGERVQSLREIHQETLKRLTKITNATYKRSSHETRNAIARCWPEDRETCFILIKIALSLAPTEGDCVYLFETAKLLLIDNNYDIQNEFMRYFFDKFSIDQLVKVFAARYNIFYAKYQHDSIINKNDYNCHRLYGYVNKKGNALLPLVEEFSVISSETELREALVLIQECARESGDTDMINFCEIYLQKLLMANPESVASLELKM